MDWQTVLQDTALISGISISIAFIIDFIKKLYYKIPWGWVQKTPGEVWFALSIALGLGVALVVLWPVIFTGEGTITEQLTAAVYGLVFGAGSKLVHSVSSSAGAKLQSFKLEHKAKTDVMTQSTGYIKPGTGVEALTNLQPATTEISCATPVLESAPAPNIPDLTQEDLKNIDVVINGKRVPLAELYKEVDMPNGYFVKVNDVLYQVKGKK